MFDPCRTPPGVLAPAVPALEVPAPSNCRKLFLNPSAPPASCVIRAGSRHSPGSGVPRLLNCVVDSKSVDTGTASHDPLAVVECRAILPFSPGSADRSTRFSRHRTGGRVWQGLELAGRPETDAHQGALRPSAARTRRRSDPMPELYNGRRSSPSRIPGQPGEEWSSQCRAGTTGNTCQRRVNRE